MGLKLIVFFVTVTHVSGSVTVAGLILISAYCMLYPCLYECPPGLLGFFKPPQKPASKLPLGMNVWVHGALR